MNNKNFLKNYGSCQIRLRTKGIAQEHKSTPRRGTATADGVNFGGIAESDTAHDFLGERKQYELFIGTAGVPPAT